MGWRSSVSYFVIFSVVEWKEGMDVTAEQSWRNVPLDFGAWHSRLVKLESSSIINLLQDLWIVTRNLFSKHFTTTFVKTFKPTSVAVSSTGPNRSQRGSTWPEPTQSGHMCFYDLLRTRLYTISSCKIARGSSLISFLAYPGNDVAILRASKRTTVYERLQK